MRALLSVSDKTGLVDLARGLAERNVELVSTGGTARVLRDAGLKVMGISEVTGFPEMMDGRVKTLHPAVHGAILARRHRPDDLSALAHQGILPIDLVAVNLYPFASAATRPDTSFDELIEQIDIGGPSMVRSAAKNFRDVLVLVDPADYSRVLQALDDPGRLDQRFRFDLARKAIAHTAEYDGTIAAALAAVGVDDGRFTRAPLTLDGLAPDHLALSGRKLQDLRYGENRTSRRRSTGSIRRGASERRRSCRARRCRSPTCWISTRPRAWRWSSPRPPPWSSSTRTRAGWRRPKRSAMRTSRPARSIPCRRSAASSG